MNKKGNVPAIAVALLVFLFIAIIATVVPEVKQTILDILTAIFG